MGCQKPARGIFEMEFKILSYVFAYIQQPWWDPEMFNPKNSEPSNSHECPSEKGKIL